MSNHLALKVFTLFLVFALGGTIGWAFLSRGWTFAVPLSASILSGTLCSLVSPEHRGTFSLLHWIPFAASILLALSELNINFGPTTSTTPSQSSWWLLPILAATVVAYWALLHLILWDSEASFVDRIDQDFSPIRIILYRYINPISQSIATFSQPVTQTTTVPEQRTAAEPGPSSTTETVARSRQALDPNDSTRTSTSSDAFDAAFAAESGMFEPSPPPYFLIPMHDEILRDRMKEVDYR